MSRSLRHWVISLFILLARGSGWLMLWTLGFYLTHNGQQAALFLPHGVYLALLILLSRRYWPALVLPPVLMLFWLHSEQLVNGYILLAAPLISLIPASIGQSYWHRFPLLAALNAAAGRGDDHVIAQYPPAFTVYPKPGNVNWPGIVYRRRAADAVCLSDL